MGIMQRSTHARLRRGCQYEEATGQKGVFRVAQDTTVLWYGPVHVAQLSVMGAGVPRLVRVG